MQLSLIVAMASNHAIGLNNKMPWHLSADLKKFKHITMGHPIIMGRKTFESIGRPLPGRQNIIISRNPDYRQQDCLVFNSLEAAIQSCADCDEVFVIGGATLYKVALALADKLYITAIHQAFEGDTYFPELNKQQWREVAREDIKEDATFDYSFITYVRQ